MAPLDSWPDRPAPGFQRGVKLQPDSTAEGIGPNELADPAEPVVNTAAMQVEFGGDILHRTVVVVEELQDGQELTVSILPFKGAVVDGSRVIPTAGGLQAVEELIDPHRPAVHQLSQRRFDSGRLGSHLRLPVRPGKLPDHLYWFADAQDDAVHRTAGTLGQLQLVMHQHLRMNGPTTRFTEKDHRMRLGPGAEEGNIDADGGLKRR